ncbi:hypothetical protein CPB85DRAFT_476942 [Mucidula mucida]|nr:hypothetical protein CPB85DRAFT_476942 [Mucidula mucida]
MGQALYSVQLEQKQKAQTMSTPRRRPRRNWWQDTTTIDVPRVPPNSASSLDRERERIHLRDIPESPLRATTRSRPSHSPASWMNHTNGFSPAPINLFSAHPVSHDARESSWDAARADLPSGFEGSLRLDYRRSGNDDPFTDDYYVGDTQSVDSGTDSDKESDSDTDSDAESVTTLATTAMADDEPDGDDGRSSPCHDELEKVLLGSTARGQEVYGIRLGDNCYVLL